MTRRGGTTGATADPLVDAARSGDRGAFARLVRREAGRLVAAARSEVVPPDLVDAILGSIDEES